MTQFQVEVVAFADLQEIKGSWTAQDFKQLLGRMDFGDTAGLAESELREMCILSLQDLKPAEAAALLLDHRLGDELKKGQIQNISYEMMDEKLWKEYADMPLHERLFHVGSLLYQAFPQTVPVPDAVQIELGIRAEDKEAELLLAQPLHESLLVRLLADGMPDSAPIKRLFGEALAGQPFAEAESIAWNVIPEAVDTRNLRLQVVGCGYWLDALRGTESFASSAQSDTALAR